MTELIRIDILNIFLAGIVLTFSLIALGLSFFRLKNKDYSLLSFGTFTLLYCLRWLAQTPTMQAAAGFIAPSFPYINAYVTYIIPVPFLLYLNQVFGKGRLNSLQWVLRGTILYAAIGVFSDIVQRRLYTLGAYTPAVMIIFICIAAAGIHQPFKKHTRDANVLMFGLIALILFVVNSNLVNLNLLPWRWGNEQPGMICLVFALGYVAANRFFTNEKKLLSVELEMETAREIQSRILPGAMPSVKGLEIAARYIPMSAVAGDFYDFIIEDDKRLCILVADVSGHGVGAALIGSMLKVAFAAQAEHIFNPARVLEGINEILYGRIEGNFVTACCLFIDLEKRSISYANAGHPQPLLLIKNNGGICNLENSGTILGHFHEVKYENVILSMKTDYRILLYTDGIIETRNRLDEFFGDERLQEFFKTNSDTPVREFADKLIDSLYAWSGKSIADSLDDDLTVLVVDVVYQSDAASIT
jgi:sigma-B regulation protein RsbU (phosphoserine phosphatase)